MSGDEGQMSSALSAGAFTQYPLYKEVKLRITKSLMDGQWKSGEALPSEAQLARGFNVSIGTLRKAVDELVQEKVLVRQQGRGTFVATHNESRTLYYFFHIVGEDGVRRFPTSELLAFSRGKADTLSAGRLRIGRGDKVILIRNVLKLEGEPVVLDNITLPAAQLGDLTERIFRNRENTIYNLYQTRYGINVIRTVDRLRALISDDKTAAALGLQRGSPVLEIDRTALTYHDAPVELRRSYVNTAHHHYLSDLGKYY